MKRFVISALVTLAAACGPKPPPLPPPDGPGDCKSATETLRGLGGCGLTVERYEQNCEDATREEAAVGSRFPAGCQTAATSCEAFLGCT